MGLLGRRADLAQGAHRLPARVGIPVDGLLQQAGHGRARLFAHLPQGHGGQDGPGAVGAAVVHEDDLVSLAEGVEVALEAGVGLVEHRLLVEEGDDDAQDRRAGGCGRGTVGHGTSRKGPPPGGGVFQL